MRDGNVAELLNQFLKTSREISSRFNADLNDVEKKEIAIDFQTKVMSLLDYSHISLPVNRKKLKDYCGRPYLNEPLSGYLTRSLHKSRPPVAEEFFTQLYELNKKHKCALSYIKGGVKHEEPNHFGINTPGQLNYRLQSTHPNPIHIHNDGDIDVAGIVSFKPGSRVQLANMQFVTPKGVVDIDYLENIPGTFEGDIIIFDDTHKESFLEWATDCMNICEQTIELRNSIDKSRCIDDTRPRL
jgi:hypothetical protein